MKIVTPADNGPRAHQPGFGLDPYESRRRHDTLARRVAYAKEAGIIEAALPANSKSKVDNAARAMVQSYQLGKVSRQQIEEEQRADETRLKGWEVAKPLPGTIHAEEIPKIKYRMAVRARALEEIASLDLAAMISTTDRHRHALQPTPHAKPWRAGTGYTNSPAKRGKPIGLREFNACHEPAGSRKGGQFASGTDCGGGGGSKEPPSGTVARDWSDYGYGGKPSGSLKTGVSALRDRVSKIDPQKRLQYAEDRANRVMDDFDAGQANIGPKSATRQRQVSPSSPTGTIFRDDPGEYGLRNPESGVTHGRNLSKEDAENQAANYTAATGKPAHVTRQRAAPETGQPGDLDRPETLKTDWRAESARLEQKYGQDDGRGPIDEYKGVPIYTLGHYTTPYYYVSRRHAPLSFRNKVGSVNHHRSISKIRRLIDGIKKATG